MSENIGWDEDSPMNSDNNFDAEWGDNPMMDSFDDIEELEEEEPKKVKTKSKLPEGEKSVFSSSDDIERPDVPVGRSGRKRSKTIGRRTSYKVVSKEEFIKKRAVSSPKTANETIKNASSNKPIVKKQVGAKKTSAKKNEAKKSVIKKATVKKVIAKKAKAKKVSSKKTSKKPVIKKAQAKKVAKKNVSKKKAGKKK